MCVHLSLWTIVDAIDNREHASQYMASRGHRVIACAQKLLPGDIYDHDYEFSKKDARYPSTEYCFCGLISLEDPPKHGVREAIGTLRLAGIKVMMVTGDHPKTAEAIARKINLILGDTKESLSKKTGRSVEEIYDDEVDAVVIHGDDIDSLQGWQWDQSACCASRRRCRRCSGTTCSLREERNRFCSHLASAQAGNRYALYPAI